MKGFFDAVCSHCGAKIGWHGEFFDKPACHKCGMGPGEAIEQMKELDGLTKIGYQATNQDLAKMQKHSGLSYGQLAKKLSIPVSTVKKVVNDDGSRERLSLRSDIRREWVDLCGFGD